MTNEFFKEKYLKYKEMYLKLKQYGAGIKWQYENKGKWVDYNDEQNIEIEKGYQKRISDKYSSYSPDIQLTINSNKYTIQYVSDIDFPGDPPHAYQIANGTRRPMRRFDTDDVVIGSSNVVPESNYTWFIGTADDRGNSSLNTIDTVYIRLLEHNYPGKTTFYHTFNNQEYRITFTETQWWNKTFHAIQTNMKTGKERPLVRSKM